MSVKDEFFYPKEEAKMVGIFCVCFLDEWTFIQNNRLMKFEKKHEETNIGRL